MRILLALVLVLGLTAAAEPQASLPDIEDEVMCVECQTALNVSTVAGRRPGARSSSARRSPRG